MISLKLAFFIFGLSSKASLKDLKKRYWQLARTHHPDSGGKVEKMQEINDAYQLLKEHVQANIDKRLYQRRHSSYGKEAFFVSTPTEDFET